MPFGSCLGLPPPPPPLRSSSPIVYFLYKSLFYSINLHFAFILPTYPQLLYCVLIMQVCVCVCVTFARPTVSTLMYSFVGFLHAQMIVDDTRGRRYPHTILYYTIRFVSWIICVHTVYRQSIKSEYVLHKCIYTESTRMSEHAKRKIYSTIEIRTKCTASTIRIEIMYVIYMRPTDTYMII